MIKNEDYKKFWLNLFDQKLEIDEEDFFVIGIFYLI